MDPYLGQIESFAFGIVPKNWLPCNGQLLPIANFQALYSLLGTTYGGNGTTNFALPDLRGRIAMGIGQGPGLQPAVLGTREGEEMHTLLWTEVPSHSHVVNAVNNGVTGGTNAPGPSVMLGSGRLPSGGTAINIYSAATPTLPMTDLNFTGGQPHENRMPYLALNYCICFSGAFPPRS